MRDLDRTVRDFLDTLGNARDYLFAAETITAIWGDQSWQETTTIGDFTEIIYCSGPFGERIREDAMAETLRQIQALPVTT